jgi:hypothetical protein
MVRERQRGAERREYASGEAASNATEPSEGFSPLGFGSS